VGFPDFQKLKWADSPLGTPVQSQKKGSWYPSYPTKNTAKPIAGARCVHLAPLIGKPFFVRSFSADGSICHPHPPEQMLQEFIYIFSPLVTARISGVSVKAPLYSSRENFRSQNFSLTPISRLLIGSRRTRTFSLRNGGGEWQRNNEPRLFCSRHKNTATDRGNHAEG
jgi:hypothetical protein